MNNSAGVVPVVLLGVFRYRSRKRNNFSFSVPVSFFLALKDCLNVCTNLSASPFEAG